NVFPVPIGNSEPAIVPDLRYSRIHFEQLDKAFAGVCNPALICGITSQNLFALRCATNELFAAQLNELARRRKKPCGIRHAIGGDVLLLCTEGVVKNVPSGTIPGIEIVTAPQWLLVPPAIDDDGV